VKTSQLSIALLFLFIAIKSIGQLEYSKWYFGNYAGLDFTTSPPTTLQNSAMVADEGCASISDLSGNFLFYTNGQTVWDKTHVIMQNGSNLIGHTSSTQSSLVLRKPGSSNLYYIFTQNPFSGVGLAYSIVDMNLAAGLGSVTVKNFTLAQFCDEKLTGTHHCNGTDYWVCTRDYNSSVFRSFLLTVAGVNTVPITSSAGSNSNTSAAGYMKISPSGKKAAIALSSAGILELFDFDNTTGVFSNAISLSAPGNFPYGCEFSPDGSRFYGATTNGTYAIYQWDICAGSNSAIAASTQTIAVLASKPGALQLATDGKIYIARSVNQHSLAVINDPNKLGSLCGFSDFTVSIEPNYTQQSLPNFIAPLLRPLAGSFSYSNSCLSFSFTVPQPTVCQQVSFSLTNVSWQFGDPASGSNNSSTSMNPQHLYSSPGTYTTKLIMYYSCTGGIDTIQKVVTVGLGSPTLSVAGNFSVCSGQNMTYSASGASGYTWSTGSNISAISVTPTTAANSTVVTYTVSGSIPTSSCVTAKILTVNVSKCAGISGNKSNDGFMFPNPSDGMVNFHLVQPCSVFVYNIQGQELFQKKCTHGDHSENLNFLNEGIYFVLKRSAQSVDLVKLVIANR
jgi:hypothetical protein